MRHLWGPFGLALTFNSGFAFSLFSGRAALITALLCVGVAVLAWAVAQVRTVPMAVGAGLVLGGAVGNLCERIFGGHGGRVPDFITLNYWPTFNLADACVTVGCGHRDRHPALRAHRGAPRGDDLTWWQTTASTAP